MSNVIAGIVRGQIPYLDSHIAQKRAIDERYKEGFRDLPVSMNPYDRQNSLPNFWLSCLLIDPAAMCQTVRGEGEALYRTNAFITRYGNGRAQSNAYIAGEGTEDGRPADIGADIFERGLCLPSDNKMTEGEQD